VDHGAWRSPRYCCIAALRHYTTIFEGINKLISYVAPPITAVFLLGVFWKRASGQSAFITLVAGMALGAVMFVVDWNGLYKGDFMLTAFLLLLACLAIMVATTFLFPDPSKKKPDRWFGKIGANPLRGKAHGRGLGNYRLASAAVLATFVILYVIFR